MAWLFPDAITLPPLPPALPAGPITHVRRAVPVLSALKFGAKCFGVGLRVGVWGVATGAVAWWLFDRSRDQTDYHKYIAQVEPHFKPDPDAAFVELDAERGDPGFERVEEAGSQEDGAGDDAPPGFAARRRRVRRKKVVAVPYAGGSLQGPYCTELVSEARLFTQARTYSVANADFLRVFFVRRMTEHGVRPSHIAACIDKMVLACFHLSEEDKAFEAGLRVQRRHRLQRGAGPIKPP